MFSASEILDLAVRLEENGESYYRKALEHVSSPVLRDVLCMLADEEAGHRELFCQMKAALPERSGNGWADELSGAILQSAMEKGALSLQEVDFRAIETEEALMEKAIEFEQDGILFYEIIGSFVSDPEVLKNIDAIIAEERKHIELFQRLIPFRENQLIA